MWWPWGKSKEEEKREEFFGVLDKLDRIEQIHQKLDDLTAKLNELQPYADAVKAFSHPKEQVLAFVKPCDQFIWSTCGIRPDNSAAPISLFTCPRGQRNNTLPEVYGWLETNQVEPGRLTVHMHKLQISQVVVRVDGDPKDVKMFFDLPCVLLLDKVQTMFALADVSLMTPITPNLVVGEPLVPTWPTEANQLEPDSFFGVKLHASPQFEPTALVRVKVGLGLTKVQP